MGREGITLRVWQWYREVIFTLISCFLKEIYKERFYKWHYKKKLKIDILIYLLYFSMINKIYIYWLEAWVCFIVNSCLGALGSFVLWSTSWTGFWIFAICTKTIGTRLMELQFAKVLDLNILYLLLGIVVGLRLLALLLGKSKNEKHSAQWI